MRTYSWRGYWLPKQSYLINDIVEYKAISYICILAHISLAATKPGVAISLVSHDQPIHVWAQYWEDESRCIQTGGAKRTPRTTTQETK